MTKTKKEIQEDIHVWEASLQRSIRERNEYLASPQGRLMAGAPYPDPILKVRDDSIMRAEQRLSELYEELKTAR